MLGKIISSQFEMKDSLKWKLGLRSTTEVNTGKLGLKHINLNKNILGTKSAMTLASVLKNDEYLRAISLKKNKIGEEGIKEMLSVCQTNRKLLQVDLSSNGGHLEGLLEWKKEFHKELLLNVRLGIKNYQKKKTRINFE